MKKLLSLLIVGGLLAMTTGCPQTSSPKAGGKNTPSAKPPSRPPAPGDTNKPAKPEDKPAKPEDKPVKPEDKPAKPGDKPAKPEDKPAKPGDKPAKPEDKPKDKKDK